MIKIMISRFVHCATQDKSNQSKFIIMAKSKMTVKDAARISSATAKKNGGDVPKGSFASRATKAAAKGAKK